MTEKGVVESVSNGCAVVAIVRKTACGDSCKSCSGGCKLTKNKVTVKNDIGAKCGDIVYVETSSSKVLSSAFAVYILPLIVFFAGYFITDSFLDNNIIPVITALVLFALTFIILHAVDKKRRIEITIRKID